MFVGMRVSQCARGGRRTVRRNLFSFLHEDARGGAQVVSPVVSALTWQAPSAAWVWSLQSDITNTTVQFP